MTARDKKMVKLLSVLGPILLLAVWYGYSQIQSTKARRNKQKQKAQQQSSTSDQNPAAAKGTRALPSPPPGVKPADKHASVPAAAPFAGVRIAVDTAAQSQEQAGA